MKTSASESVLSHAVLPHEAGADHLPDEDGSVSAAKNLLASIQWTNIGISAFGFGLKRCDSVEF